MIDDDDNDDDDDDDDDDDESLLTGKGGLKKRQFDNKLFVRSSLLSVNTKWVTSYKAKCEAFLMFDSRASKE